jgi:hypothetical protein
MDDGTVSDVVRSAPGIRVLVRFDSVVTSIVVFSYGLVTGKVMGRACAGGRPRRGPRRQRCERGRGGEGARIRWKATTEGTEATALREGTGSGGGAHTLEGDRGGDHGDSVARGGGEGHGSWLKGVFQDD